MKLFTNDFEVIEKNKTTKPISFYELKHCLDLSDEQEKQNQKLLVFQETLNELEKMHRHPNYMQIKKKVSQIKRNFDKYIHKINTVIKLDRYGDIKWDTDIIIMSL